MYAVKVDSSYEQIDFFLLHSFKYLWTWKTKISYFV